MVAGLVNGDSPLGVMVIGTDPATDEEAASHLISGHRLSADDEVLLVENFARSLQLAVGGTVRLLAPQGVQKFASRGWSSPVAWPDSMAAQWCLCRYPPPYAYSSLATRSLRFPSCWRIVPIRTLCVTRSPAGCPRA